MIRQWQLVLESGYISVHADQLLELSYYYLTIVYFNQKMPKSHYQIYLKNI